MFVVFAFIAFQLLVLALPSPENIVRREGFATQILDRNGEGIYDIFVNERRTKVPLETIPDYLKKATISIEDKNFYRHQGFDPLAYPRLVYRAIFQRRIQGGSTLTQQLVKNVLLTNERSALRKINELVLALQIEQRYTKDQILELYLNEVPYGGTSWGVATASETYFGKNVSELNLVESAILAGLPQLPSVYSPHSSTPKAYIKRTEQVLRRMREDGHITKEQEEQATSELANVTFRPRGASMKAPHFAQYVQEKLEERYGIEAVQKGGLKVTTSLDLKMQEFVEIIVKEEIDKASKLGIGNSAVVVLDNKTGEILAMVGSKDFTDESIDGQVNVALRPRQPGSAFKPITYLAGIKKGYTASYLFADTPTKFPAGAGQPDYEPGNYDGKFRGPVQMRYALGNSLNIPAVKMQALVGLPDTLSLAYDLGLSTLEPTKDTLSRVGLSLSLGGGEVKLLDLTGAYASIFGGGRKITPSAILRVVDRDGRVLEENRPEKGKAVVTPEQAYIITNILSDNDARKDVFGANSLLNIPGRQIAVKTGTTNDRRDNWAIGGSPEVTVGVWVGNNDNTPMTRVASGVSGASPIWNRIIKEATKGFASSTFERPSGIVEAKVDAVSGYAAHSGLPERTEIFVQGTQPNGTDPIHLNLKLCRGDNKLATPSDIAAGNFDTRQFIKLSEKDPISPNGQNRWQEGIDLWVASLSSELQSKYRPPTEFCGGQSSFPINVEFIEPRDRTSNLPQNFTIKFMVDAIEDLAEVKLEINGVLVKTFENEKYEYQASLNKGKHSLRVVAKDSKGRESDRRIDIGVEGSWE